MAVGDATLPLCGPVIGAFHEAVDDQANAAAFRGYMLEVGAHCLCALLNKK